MLLFLLVKGKKPKSKRPHHVIIFLPMITSCCSQKDCNVFVTVTYIKNLYRNMNFSVQILLLYTVLDCLSLISMSSLSTSRIYRIAYLQKTWKCIKYFLKLLLLEKLGDLFRRSYLKLAFGTIISEIYFIKQVMILSKYKISLTKLYFI